MAVEQKSDLEQSFSPEVLIGQINGLIQQPDGFAMDQSPPLGRKEVKSFVDFLAWTPGIWEGFIDDTKALIQQPDSDQALKAELTRRIAVARGMGMESNEAVRGYLGYLEETLIPSLPEEQKLPIPESSSEISVQQLPAASSPETADLAVSRSSKVDSQVQAARDSLNKLADEVDRVGKGRKPNGKVFLGALSSLADRGFLDDPKILFLLEETSKLPAFQALAKDPKVNSQFLKDTADILDRGEAARGQVEARLKLARVLGLFENEKVGEQLRQLEQIIQGQRTPGEAGQADTVAQVAAIPAGTEHPVVSPDIKREAGLDKTLGDYVEGILPEDISPEAADAVIEECKGHTPQEVQAALQRIIDQSPADNAYLNNLLKLLKEQSAETSDVRSPTEVLEQIDANVSQGKSRI